MVHKTIMTVSFACLPLVSTAQALPERSFATEFAYLHWDSIVENCPAEADRHARLTDYAVFHGLNQPIGDDGRLEMLMQNFAAGSLDPLDIRWGGIVFINSYTVVELLKVADFGKNVDQEDGASFADEENRLRDRATAAMDLAECYWPNDSIRASLEKSMWATDWSDLAQGVCDIHFFTLMRRFIDTPVAGLPPEDRGPVKEKILVEHQKYLDESRDASKCGEFL